LSEPKSIDRMFEELVAAVTSSTEMPPLDVVRQWKRAELLRIGIEDVMGLVDLEQVQRELTCLAEVTLRIALHQARRELQLVQLPFAIIGLGKFGGEELGYGADLDVLFIGGRGDGDQASAIRLAAKVIEFMTQPTEQGTLFPVDPRLRPDGEKGSLASALEAHRDYYQQRAELWERQALTKARFVAGDEDLGRRFVEMAHEIVYAKPLTAAEADKIRRMRERIETERGNQRDRQLEFKTGPGGIIDIEFLVQALQLRHGPAHPPLRTPQTLALLNRLTALGLVEEADSFHLRRHYLWLRRLESVLRRVENTSVSRLPAAEAEQKTVARRLGLDSREELLRTYSSVTAAVRQIFVRAFPR
jgi:glutamate-ammonia-ligase adenylyltransferase